MVATDRENSKDTWKMMQPILDQNPDTELVADAEQAPYVRRSNENDWILYAAYAENMAVTPIYCSYAEDVEIQITPKRDCCY